MLRESRKFVKLSANQYGGKKGVGTAHFLINTWDEITSCLEDNRAGVVLTAVDYSKAFNRLEHLPCLESLAKLGLPNQLLQIIAGFLSGRSMTVRVREARSAHRPVNAGAPQGSVLGSFLFNAGINDLDEGYHDTTIIQPDKIETAPSSMSAKSTPQRPSRNPFLRAPESPISGSLEFKILPQVRNVPKSLRIMPKWHEERIKISKYIDDGLFIEKVNFHPLPPLEMEGKKYKEFHATRSECLFEHVAARARNKGMVVNDAKTAVLCIADTVIEDHNAYIRAGTEKIIGGDELKVLGFTFTKSPTVNKHVSIVTSKIRSRTWALRKLRRSGFTTEELITFYKASILSLIHI